MRQISSRATIVYKYVLPIPYFWIFAYALFDLYSRGEEKSMIAIIFMLLMGLLVWYVINSKIVDVVYLDKEEIHIKQGSKKCIIPISNILSVNTRFSRQGRVTVELKNSCSLGSKQIKSFTFYGALRLWPFSFSVQPIVDELVEILCTSQEPELRH